MNEIVAIVEGQTEQPFVRDVLAEHLGGRGMSIWAVLPGRSRRKGGVKKWKTARGDIIRTLREGRYCTTMFDFYALPEDWPGRKEAATLPWEERGEHVEQAISNEIAAAYGESFDRRQFVPYVQVHEFEALLFSNITELARSCEAVSDHPSETLRQRLQAVLDEAANPEAIDDGHDTCPSRRILRVVRGYRKATLGPIIAGRIGIETLRGACLHFASWLERLEKVAPTS